MNFAESVDYQVGYLSSDSREPEDAHHHESCVILLALSGRGTYLLDSCHYTFDRHSLLIIPAASFHQSQTLSGVYRRYFVSFPNEVLERCRTEKTDLRPFFERALHLTLGEEEAAGIQRLIEACDPQNDREADCFGGDLLRRLAFVELLLAVCRCAEHHQAPQGLPEAQESRVTPILSYIRAHLADDLSLDRIAGALYMNKYYMCQLFKRETGMTLGGYIVRSRLQHAQRTLRAGYSVQQAGEEAGFQSYAHFIRTFTEHIGLSPGKYARQARQPEIQGEG